MGNGLKRTKVAARVSRQKPTLDDGMNAVARNLVEFGYPDVTGKMIREIYDAWLAGKRWPDLPHGIVGAFAERQFEDNKEKLAVLAQQPC